MRFFSEPPNRRVYWETEAGVGQLRDQICRQKEMQYDSTTGTEK
jgi:hypothetical protein